MLHLIINEIYLSSSLINAIMLYHTSVNYLRTTYEIDINPKYDHDKKRNVNIDIQMLQLGLHNLVDSVNVFPYKISTFVFK